MGELKGLAVKARKIAQENTLERKAVAVLEKMLPSDEGLIAEVCLQASMGNYSCSWTILEELLPVEVLEDFNLLVSARKELFAIRACKNKFEESGLSFSANVEPLQGKVFGAIVIEFSW